MSVYADASRPGLDETRAGRDARRSAHPRTSARTTARSRRAARTRSARRSVARALIVRPGLIVGPLDPTDRFALLGRALRCPELARRESGAAPSFRRRRIASVQFIDARDLAAWMLDMVGERSGRHVQRVQLRRAMDDGRRSSTPRSSARARPAARPRRSGSTTKRCSATASRRGPGCRCGFPHPIAESAGFMHFACARAVAQGLALRPLAQTIDDTAAWLRAARQLRRVAQRAVGGEGTRDIGRHRAGAERVAARRAGRAIIADGARRGVAFTHGPPTNAALLEFALRTAQAAGEAILPHFRAALDVEDKGGCDGLRPGHRRRSRGRGGHPGARSRAPIPTTAFAARSTARERGHLAATPG